MEKLHNSRLSAWANKLQVDHEEGLTTAQLMVRAAFFLHALIPLLLLIMGYYRSYVFSKGEKEKERKNWLWDEDRTAMRG